MRVIYTIIPLEIFYTEYIALMINVNIKEDK